MKNIACEVHDVTIMLQKNITGKQKNSSNKMLSLLSNALGSLGFQTDTHLSELTWHLHPSLTL